MIAPRLIVLPAVAYVVPIVSAIAIVSITTWNAAKEHARANAAEAALSDALTANARVNEVLFRCEAGHARIADRIEVLQQQVGGW